MRLTRNEWRTLLRWFLRGVSSAQIALETGLDRKRVLRALTVVRLAMMDSVPTAQRVADAEVSRVPRAEAIVPAHRSS